MPYSPMAKTKKYRVTGVGIECPKCKRPTEMREHTSITDKHLRQPFYFTKWYYCQNQDCVVTTHMAEEFKVWNKNGAAKTLQNHYAAYDHQENDLALLRQIMSETTPLF